MTLPSMRHVVSWKREATTRIATVAAARRRRCYCDVAATAVTLVHAAAAEEAEHEYVHVAAAEMTKKNTLPWRDDWVEEAEAEPLLVAAAGVEKLAPEEVSSSMLSPAIGNCCRDTPEAEAGVVAFLKNSAKFGSR